ncbi:Hsp20/alpha crystallin family protein [Paenibacillus sp. GCM10028914]|uniref:Hsp20/alpha crystallin family protein n=1 Tax=Paenibacillus sp. GCM10028914 TaxID=3273416 RepID=UPI00361F0628
MSSKTNDLDWLNEDPFFKKLLPFKAIQEHLSIKPDDVDQYVENALREANLNSSLKGRDSSKLHYEHIDTHHLLITKIRVPKKIHPENLWVQLNRTQIRINGFDDNDENQIIQLPTPIIPEQSKATFKQGSLQLKMPKMTIGRFKDVSIRYL